jgi:hypothetical protein
VRARDAIVTRDARLTDVCCRHRLAGGGSEKLQLTALLGVFKNAVELTAKENKGGA